MSPSGEEMKITRKQLKSIIRKEVRSLNESIGDWIPGIEGEQEKIEREAAERYPEAFNMYEALSGAGTDEKGVRDILNRIGASSNMKAEMKNLVDGFNRITSSRDDTGFDITDYGSMGGGHKDLVQWLVADGMTIEATIVKYVTDGVVSDERRLGLGFKV